VESGAGQLYAGPVRLAQSPDLSDLLERLENELQLLVAASSHRRVFVHAGVVAWRGRAIVLPGRSFTGKTTLVAALVQAGAIYYSDEYAVLDSRGRVHPYPRRLSIREAGRPQPRRCRPEDLGGHAGAGPLPVGLVALTWYRAGTVWRPLRLAPGDLALGLMANTVAIRLDPARVLGVLRQVAGDTIALKGVRGSAEDTATALLQYLDT
jgi:hypothetical protein